MSRRKKREIRSLLPDPKYNSTQVSKFINYVMRRGKKSTSQKIVYDAFAIIEKRAERKGLDVFLNAIENVSPFLEVRSRRIGGANYQIPFPVEGERKFTLASRWIIGVARNKKGKAMSEKLASELIAASKKQGDAIKKREDTHAMAEANKAFSHYRW